VTGVDAEVRDAVQRMRIPDHQPDFWDHLAGQIDRIEGRRASDRNRRAAAAAQHRAETAPSREVSAAIPTPVRPADEAAPEPYQPRELPHDLRHVVVAGPSDGPSGGPTAGPSEAPDDGPVAPVLEGRFGAGSGAQRQRRTGPSNHAPRRHGTRHVRVERDLAVVPQAMRHRSNVAVAVLAVAAVAVVAFAGSTLVRSRSGGGAAETAIEAEDTAFRADSLAAGSTDPAAKAVLAWVGRLGDGDIEASWAALGAASQQALGGRSRFDDRFDALAAEWGAWASAQPDALLITPVTASDEGTVSVVTLIGTVGGDQRADAFPVRISAGVAKVEAFADAGKIGLESPDSSQGAEVGTDDELSVVVPGGVTPIVRLDQGPVQRCGEAAGTSLETTDGGDHQRCTYSPQGGMDEGGRVLTVAFTSRDGQGVSARSVRFKAA
jgi:hypothetical protein